MVKDLPDDQVKLLSDLIVLQDRGYIEGGYSTMHVEGDPEYGLTVDSIPTVTYNGRKRLAEGVKNE